MSENRSFVFPDTQPHKVNYFKPQRQMNEAVENGEDRFLDGADSAARGLEKGLSTFTHSLTLASGKLKAYYHHHHHQITKSLKAPPHKPATKPKAAAASTQRASMKEESL